MKRILTILAIAAGLLALSLPILMSKEDNATSALAQDKTKPATIADADKLVTDKGEIEKMCKHGIELLKRDGQAGMDDTYVASSIFNGCVRGFTMNPRPKRVIDCMLYAQDRETFTACDPPKLASR